MEDKPSGLMGIAVALGRVKNMRIIALEVPSDALEKASAQEDGTSGKSADISNVEHLFQRLNRGGTKLDGDELTYSMIKAYWPQLENPIEEIVREDKKRLMPEARLAVLGTRLAITDFTKDKIWLSDTPIAFFI